MAGMELYDVMRTTGAARQFTDDPLPDEVLERILDNARFAPEWWQPAGHARDRRPRPGRPARRLVELSHHRRAPLHRADQNGEGPWNPVAAMRVDAEDDRRRRGAATGSPLC